MDVFEYVIVGILVFGMNVIPAFIPPTWMVLLYFFVKFNLALIPTVIVGATAATLGRWVLAHLATHFQSFLPKATKENMLSLGTFFNAHSKLSIPLVIVYAFLPIPSNHVYIAAGLAGANLKILAGSFFIGRLISYSFWLAVTHKIVTSLESVFHTYYTRPRALAVELVGFILLFLLMRIKWKKLLKNLHYGKRR